MNGWILPTREPTGRGDGAFAASEKLAQLDAYEQACERGVRRGKPLPLMSIGVDTAVVDPRRPNADRPRGGQNVALVVKAIAHHQTPAVLVDLITELVDIGGDLGGQRRREHLPGAVADDLIEQRP
jgi:hypothetical protein